MSSKLAGFQYRPMRALGRPTSESSDKPMKTGKTVKPTAFEKIKGGLEEVLEIATGDAKHRENTPDVAVLPTDSAVSAKVELRGALKRAGLTMTEFAALTGTPPRTAEDWGRPKGSTPPPVAIALAKVLVSSADAKSILETESNGRRSA